MGIKQWTLLSVFGVAGVWVACEEPLGSVRQDSGGDYGGFGPAQDLGPDEQTISEPDARAPDATGRDAALPDAGFSDTGPGDALQPDVMLQDALAAETPQDAVFPWSDSVLPDSVFPDLQPPDSVFPDLQPPGGDDASDAFWPRGGGVLQFSSGFEADVAIQNDRYLVGVDNSGIAGKNDWDDLPSYLGWAEGSRGYFQSGSMELTADPLHPQNRVLHFHNGAIVPGGDRSRSQYMIAQVMSWTDPGGPNLFDRQFYRYRLLIPGRIKDLVPQADSSPWYVIWEAHTWESEDRRHVIFLRKPANESTWQFWMRQQIPDGKGGQQTVWESLGVDVPFDQWFTFEVFFRYHSADGEFFSAVTRDGSPRQVVGHWMGATQNGTKLRDQMILKMYHSRWYADEATSQGLDGTHQYYDDLEIWSDYPPGYWP